MKLNEQLFDEVNSRVNISNCRNVALSLMRQKDLEIAEEKLELKKDLLYELIDYIDDKVLPSNIPRIKHIISKIVDEHFPQE